MIALRFLLRQDCVGLSSSSSSSSKLRDVPSISCQSPAGKKKSSLNDSRLERLQSLGFRWAKRKGQASWENHFDALVAYKAENGHCSVPTKYKEDTALGRWVSTQRAEYKKYSEGEPSQITADKIKRLEDVGFAWWMGV